MILLNVRNISSPMMNVMSHILRNVKVMDNHISNNTKSDQQLVILVAITCMIMIVIQLFNMEGIKCGINASEVTMHENKFCVII